MAAATETSVAWTPSDWRGRDETRGRVILAPVPPRSAVTPFAMWDYIARPGMSEAEVLASLFIRFHSMVVRGGIDPIVAHEAFLGVDEYRAAISPDISTEPSHG